MFSWQIWDANLTGNSNSKIGDEFEQNKLSEVCTVEFISSQICHENINKPLDGAYLADFGIDIIQS